ncbi:MAG: hypothetical protein AABY42_07845 [Nitrospirota bacterium]
MTKIRLKQGMSRPAGYCNNASSIITYACLIFILLIIASCGKKGPPTLKSYEKPDAPLSLSAVHREGNIILSWAYPANRKALIKGFNVLRSAGDGFKGIGFVANDKENYIDTDCKQGMTCQYKVVALSLTGILSKESNAIKVTPQPLPLPPEKVAFAVKNDHIELSWSGSFWDVCYNIYRTKEKGKYTLKPLNNEPVCMTSYKDTVFPELSVYYTIRSLYNTGIRDEGFASYEIVITPSDFRPSPPSGLRFAHADDRVYLTWEVSPEVWVKGYRVYRRTGDEKDFKTVAEVKTPSFTDTTTSGKKAWYMIKSLGPVSESLPLIGEIPAKTLNSIER